MRGGSEGLLQRIGNLLPDTARAVGAFRGLLRGARSERGRAGPEETVPDELALDVRQLELHVRHLVDSLFSGEYHSVFRGQGLEFSSLREYQPGDDVRAIDWKVTARRGHPYVKQFVEERELNALLVVDMSASEEFGTGERPNAEIALELAAVLALSATRNNDRVGLLLVTDEVEFFLPPGSGRRHALRLLLELHAFRPKRRGTKPSKALDFIARVIPHRAIIFLISDFILDPAELRELAETGRGTVLHHDLVPIRLRDSRADDLPDLGMLALLDPETGNRVVVNAGDAAFRDFYRADTARARAEVSSLFRELHADIIEVDTRESYIPPLLKFFGRRERMYR